MSSQQTSAATDGRLAHGEPATRSLAELSAEDVMYAGGKGANLGELVGAGMPVPPGFVVGASAYRAFLQHDGLRRRLEELIGDLDVDDTGALQAASERLRDTVVAAEIPQEIQDSIAVSYAEIEGAGNVPVAVRSSATAEDSASASFAGMNATFLNVVGEDEVIEAVRRCWASLFGSRAIYYRARRGFGQVDMEIAVVVQLQIESTRSGVMFTVNPATGTEDELVIEGSFGLGEAVVSGSVSPDRFVVDKRTLEERERSIMSKRLVIEHVEGGGVRHLERGGEEAMEPSLDESEVREVADLGRRIEQHYGSPQDTEWAIDADGTVWMLQSRPVTTLGGPGVEADEAGEEEVLARGLGAGPGIGSGRARSIATLGQAVELAEGDVLVTHMTAPDWVPLMRRAAAIVTDSGGMTCHAAIVSRELGIPCLVGTGTGTESIPDGEVVTVDASRGVVVRGDAAPATAPAAAQAAPGGAPFEASPVTGTRVMVNLSEPSQVEAAAPLPVDGVGLLRAELMLVEALEGRHPRRLIQEGKADEVVERMGASLTAFAAAFSPRPITYRTIDFRTNEFRGLEGGEEFEPEESNPMIGYRGALRYTHEPDLVRVELEAIDRVWQAGYENLHVMIPFVRTPREVEAVRAEMERVGLTRRHGFELWVMAEVPSILFNLRSLAELGVVGISIGSNDLTQLMLGADRDSELVAEVFDERDPAVVGALDRLIREARSLGLQTSICGQAPSVHREYPELLVRAGIDTVSVSVDAVARTRRLVAEAEQRLLLDAARDRLG